MPTLLLDTIESARFEQTGTVKRYTRTGVAYDLDTTNQFGTLYSVLTLTNCPQWGDFDTVTRDTQLVNVAIEPVGGGDMARCMFFYESFQGDAPSAYIVTSRAYPRSVTTNRLLGTNIPLKCEFNLPGVGDESDFFANPERLSDLVMMNPFAPMRALTVTQLVYGDPTPTPTFNGKGPIPTNNAGADKGDAICHVNSDRWRGKPAGYWMLTEFDTSQAKYKGYYVTTATAVTKVMEDWSEWGILRNTQTGKFVTKDGMSAEIEKASKLPYQRGFIYSGDGFIRVGHYPMTSFANLFGFK